MEMKFVQILAASWDGDNGRRTYSLLALGDDGRVYRLERSVGGWRPLPKRVFTSAQIKSIDKQKYGAGYVEKEDQDG